MEVKFITYTILSLIIYTLFIYRGVMKNELNSESKGVLIISLIAYGISAFFSPLFVIWISAVIYHNVFGG